MNSVEIEGVLGADPRWVTVDEADRLEIRVAVVRESGGHDSIDCYVMAGALANRLAKQKAGRELAVTGQLRSRYWSRNGQLASRMQVEVTAVKML